MRILLHPLQIQNTKDSALCDAHHYGTLCAFYDKTVRWIHAVHTSARVLMPQRSPAMISYARVDALASAMNENRDISRLACFPFTSGKYNKFTSLESATNATAHGLPEVH